MSNTNPARGMRDFLPADVRRREYVINMVKEVYERYGFEPLETPAVENIETLMGKYGEEGNQLIFKILKRGEHEKTGEADLALRYDLTVPLARVVAEYKNNLPKFFKRYQIQPVWRADRPARGRFREFYQCDVDAIGSKSMVVEAELCAAVSDVLQKLGFNDFTIRLNHRKVLEGILDAAGVPTSKHSDALIALDKLDKIGREGVEKEFQSRGIVDDAGNKLLTFFEFFLSEEGKEVFNDEQIKKFIELHKNIKNIDELGQILKSATSNWEDSIGQPKLSYLTLLANKLTDRPTLNPVVYPKEAEIAEEKKRILFIKKQLPMTFNNVRLSEIRKFIGDNKVGIYGSEQLSEILEWSQKTSANQHIKIDPSLARGLSYYTGAIMEISVPDLAGSLGGGGRYDNLVGMFSGQDVPACGFSLGLERIIVVMTERGMFPDDLVTTSADVMVTIWNEETIADSLALANELRQSGLRVEVYPEADKLGKQFKYASSRGINFVCILGDDERANNKVALKNMTTGEQETVERENVANKIL